MYWQSYMSANSPLFFSTILALVTSAFASNGDRSYVFEKCVQRCSARTCLNAIEFEHSQPLCQKLLQWSCEDECKYQCMWITVDAFQKDGSQVPQFYGKWPFLRVAGIQEPASMIFSLLNGLSHFSILYYRTKVPSSTPMYKVWHGMAAVGIVTWLCATIFHTRDTQLTEKMDYFSAFGLVLYNVFTLFCRVFGTSHKILLFIVGFLLLVMYSYHIHYLAFIQFDYGYNMKVNILVGAVNAVGWFLWCLYHRKSAPYVWKCCFAMLGLNALLALELGDFPPLFWTFDAHALWHAGTVPLNFLWYSFIIDDAVHMSTPKLYEDVKKMV